MVDRRVPATYMYLAKRTRSNGAAPDVFAPVQVTAGHEAGCWGRRRLSIGSMPVSRLGDLRIEHNGVSHGVPPIVVLPVAAFPWGIQEFNDPVRPAEGARLAVQLVGTKGEYGTTFVN